MDRRIFMKCAGVASFTPFLFNRTVLKNELIDPASAVNGRKDDIVPMDNNYNWTIRPYKKSNWPDGLVMTECRYTHRDKGRYCNFHLCYEEDVEETKAMLEKQFKSKAIPGGAWEDEGKPLRMEGF